MKKTRDEMLQARRTEASHSIYVQGFAEDTTEKQLAELFQSAGTIEKIFMDNGNKVRLARQLWRIVTVTLVYCQLCIVHLCFVDVFEHPHNSCLVNIYALIELILLLRSYSLCLPWPMGMFNFITILLVFEGNVCVCGI